MAVTRTLMGEPPDRLAETRATTSGAETVEQVVLHQSRFWPSLHAKEFEDGETVTYPPLAVLSNQWQILRALSLCTVMILYLPHLRLANYPTRYSAPLSERPAC